MNAQPGAVANILKDFQAVRAERVWDSPEIEPTLVQWMMQGIERLAVPSADSKKKDKALSVICESKMLTRLEVPVKEFNSVFEQLCSLYAHHWVPGIGHK